MTRYDAIFPEAKVDSAIDQMNPQIPDQHSANVSTGIDTFVNYKEDMLADLMTKALAGDLHIKHAKNAKGFGDV